MDYIVNQVGMVKTVCLVAGTILMILAAQFLSFRETRASESFEWRKRPLQSFLAFAVKQELNYARKIPYMVGAILLATTVAVYV